MGNWYGKLFKKEEIRILFQGLDAAGKTTALYQLKLGEVVTTIPTIGFNVETVEFMNINITVWDVGGRDKIRPLYRHYYPNTQALVFIVDSSDREESRIEQAKDEIHRTMSEDELRDIPLVVLANKQDLPNAMSVERVSEELELHKLLTNRVWKIFPTVATTGDGLQEAMDWITDACNCRTKRRPQQKDKRSDSVEPEAEPSDTKEPKESSDTYIATMYNMLKKVFSAQV